MRYELIVGTHVYRPVYTEAEKVILAEVKRTAEDNYKTSKSHMMTARTRAKYEAVKLFDGFDNNKINIQGEIDKNYPEEVVGVATAPSATVYGEAVDLADPLGVDLTIEGVDGTWFPKKQ